MKKMTVAAVMVMAMISGAANAVPLKLQPADIHEAGASCTIVVNVTQDGYTTESYGNEYGVTYKFSYLDWGKVSARTRGYIYTMVKNHCASR